jgi:hypothetical protein
MADYFENERTGQRIMKKKLLLFILLVYSSVRYSFAQIIPPNSSLISLQHFVTKLQPNTYDSSYTDLHFVIGENINYLYPLYQLLGNGKKFMSDFSLPVYYDLLSESVSFVGDYAAALEYQKASDTTHLTDVEYRQIGKECRCQKIYYVHRIQL